MSDARRLRLEVVLQAVDRATRPFRSLLKTNNELARSMKATRDQLKALERAQGLTNQFGKLRSNIGETATALKAARERMVRLREAVKAAESPTAKLVQQFRQASAESVRLASKYQAQRTQLEEVRQKLREAGRGSMTMAQYQDHLRKSTEAATRALEQQDARLKAHNSRAKAQAAVQHTADRIRARAGNLAAAGAGASVAGMAAGSPLLKGIGQAKDYEQQVSQFRALGIGEKKLQEAAAFANSINVQGLSQLDKLKLLKETYTITRDMHHAEEIAPVLAKMKVGIESVMARRGHGEGHGEIAEQMLMDLVKTTELRGSLKSPEAFKQAVDNATKAYVASGGTVKPEDFLNAIKTGGIAAKQLGDDSFYFGLLHTMQEMGGFRTGTGLMSAYTNWVQGRSTQQTAEELVNAGMVDPASVKYGKTGHVTKMLPETLEQVELYKTDPFEYMTKVLLPKINPDGKLSDQQVVSKIGQMFSARKGGDLLASLFLERANIQKHRESAPKAYGVDPLYAEGMRMTQGKEMETLAKVRDLEKEIGEKVLPLYASALEWVARAADRVTKFMQKNPGLAKAMAISVGVLAASLLVLGPIMLAIASVLGPYAMLHILLGKIGVSGGVLSAVLRGLGGAFMWVARAVLFIGRALLLTPIGLAVTAIAVAAYLIYKHWDWIKGKWREIWQGMETDTSGTIARISAIVLSWAPLRLFYAVLAPVLRWFGVDMPDKFSEFGANIIKSLIDGLFSKFPALKDALGKVAAWFKNLFGDTAPALPTPPETPALEAAKTGVGKLAGIGAGIAIGSAPALAAPISFDMRPALTTIAAAGAAAHAAPMQPIINVYPPAGADPQAIARMVRDELRQIENQRAARARSRLSDRD
ncbi:phage tail tape measure protein [Ralstonia sp. UBA689]|uniref:phage tail tape measure protein n=1 Tax=Ralstonia sp. UBA689 TaxID=1947373 RepID=UPI0025FF58A7|nr:phage tail protein [Ralstonia sp. UBA689]